MKILEAVLLGILQGLTEFIPVSSSGHLVVAQSLLPGFKEPPVLFDAMLHLGTLAAVIFFYKKELGLIITSLLPVGVNGGVKEKRDGRKLLLLLIVASCPTAIIGFTFKSQVEALFKMPGRVGMSLLITGCVLLITDKFEAKGEGLGGMKLWKAFMIGVFQGIAVVPGISRSGVTIASGIFFGLKREFAMEFSFLLAVPAVFGAVLLETSKHFHTLVSDVDLVAYLLGVMASVFVGYISIGWLLKIVQMKRLGYFGIYCLFVGTGVVLFL